MREFSSSAAGPDGLDRLVDLSPFAADILGRYPALLPALRTSGRLVRAVTDGEIANLLATELRDCPGDDEFLHRLRLFRHRELLRIIWRDLNEGADVTESLRDLSDLADAAINAALKFADDLLRARHGEPRAEDGTPCGAGVVAMGKLGGHELNFSSDVDLVFVYSAAGETDGARALSNEEYFRLLAQRVIDLLSRNTADGFVYRVDVRLRPVRQRGAAGRQRVRTGEAICCSTAGTGSATPGSRRGWSTTGPTRSPCTGTCSGPSCTAATWTTACSARCAR